MLLLQAYCGLTHTTHFFGVVALQIIWADKLPVRGIKLGRHMLEMIILAYNISNQIPGFRFPVYHTSVVLPLNKWDAFIKRMIFHALRLMKYQQEPASKKKKEQVYRDLFNGWSSNVKHLGKLGTNYIIAAAAVISVLLFWMVNEYYKAQEANPFKFFAESFSLKKKAVR